MPATILIICRFKRGFFLWGMYRKREPYVFCGQKRTKKAVSLCLMLLTAHQVPDVMFFLPARRLPDLQWLEYVRLPMCKHFRKIRSGYGTVKTVAVFCVHGTVKSWRFRSRWIVEPSTLDSFIAAKIPEPDCSIICDYGTINSKFINSFTSWQDITQPNCYH